jgi:hypothetical protein
MYNTIHLTEVEYVCHGQEIQIFSQFFLQTNVFLVKLKA